MISQRYQNYLNTILFLEIFLNIAIDSLLKSGMTVFLNQLIYRPKRSLTSFGMTMLHFMDWGGKQGRFSLYETPLLPSSQ